MKSLRFFRAHFASFASSRFIGWLPLLVIVGIGLAVRLAAIDFGLPFHRDRDEPEYYEWAELLRRDGIAGLGDGAGYPPGIFPLLIAEHWITEVARGDALTVADYYLFSRTMSSIFASVTVLLGGLFAWQMSRSRAAGWLAAAMLAVQPVFLEQSRYASANSPWTALTMGCLILVCYARRPFNLPALYGAGLLGILSMLFKYQTITLWWLPFYVLWRHGPPRLSRKLLHTGLVAGGLLAVLAWLYFGYDVMQIVNTPATNTASAFQRGRLIDLVTFDSNWRLISGVVDGLPFGLAILSGGALALWLHRRKVWQLDLEALALLIAFMVGFYLLMSNFEEVDPSKWLPVLNLLAVFWGIAVAAVGRAVGWGVLESHREDAKAETASPLFRFAFLASSRFKRASFDTVISGISAAALALVFLVPLAQRAWKQNQVLHTPTTTEVMALWFVERVPQGARVVVEGNNPFTTYTGFPGRRAYHAFLVQSILSESPDAFRQRGYEYLVADSNKPGYFSDSDNPEFLAAAEKVAEFSGQQFPGSDLAVFRLKPIQQNVRYHFVGESFSFRGFDLPESTVGAGEALKVTLYWMSTEPTQADVIVFVHVFDEAAGRMIAQKDNPPRDGLDPTWAWAGDMQYHVDPHEIPIPPDAPPGTYSLKVGMYDSGTGERLPITDPLGNAVGDSVTLAEVRVLK